MSATVPDECHNSVSTSHFQFLKEKKNQMIKRDRKHVYMELFATKYCIEGNKKAPQGGHSGSTKLTETLEKQGFPLWKKTISIFFVQIFATTRVIFAHRDLRIY